MQSDDVCRLVAARAGAGSPCALAVVLATSGSTPRKAGAKAVIDIDGTIHGTVGGGAVEAETQRRAIEAIRRLRPEVFDFQLHGTDAAADQPICGGQMRILVDPRIGVHADACRQAAAAVNARQRGLLVTTVRTSPAAIDVTVQWLAVGFADAPNLPEEVLRSAAAGQSPQAFVQDLADGRHVDTLVEAILPPLLLIAGGGHVGQSLAALASQAGYAVAVLDDRAEFLAPGLYPTGVERRCGDIARMLADWPADSDLYVAIVTRDHRHDEAALAACLERQRRGRPAAYLGMIGSRRKVAALRADLLRSGAASEAELARVHAPIGLDIGAQTVEEIAVSIVAQLIAVRRTGASPNWGPEASP
ncbi:MAG: putative xanthine dehydrogenase subunit A [Phycisphaerae bacterium]|nr:putative xanthine dehydrogenase subunit A [Phycisphaerae bacterium]